MRKLLALLALIGGCDEASIPKATVASGPPGDRRLYGRPGLLPEDSGLPDAFDASKFFFPEPLEGDHFESAGDEAVAVRIDVLRLLKREHGDMPRFRGPGASVSLLPSQGFARVALSTSGPSSAGRPR